MSELNSKEQFLDKCLFEGLVNLNDGFDADGIKYFSEAEFELVLKRAQTNGVEIYGIEPWKDKEFYGVKLAEDFYLDPVDPRWYMKAFKEFREEDSDLLYAASYGVSQELSNKIT